MNKLGKKLFLSISLTVILIFTISLLLINYLLPKYNIYKTRENLNEFTVQIQNTPVNELEEVIRTIESENNVTVAYTSINQSEDDMNEALRMQLTKKKVVLNKLWITKDEVMKVKAEGQSNKLYDQEKLKASFFAKYIAKDNTIILMGTSIAHSNEVIKTLNTFYLYIVCFSLLLIILLVWILSKIITTPLKDLSDVAQDISHLKFKRTKVKTNDEIGELAHSINIMSEKLHEAHQDLTDRNEHLKRFMGDVTHELKTPIALVKAYSMGIKDGLDDGTYVDTIIKQADQISNLIEELLRFSKLERDVLQKEEFPIEPLVRSIIDKHKIELESKEIQLQTNSNIKNQVIYADLNKMGMVFQNLISNAIKYTTNQNIIITLEERNKSVYFQIKNGINAEQIKDIDKIWEPFYVLESSRSKEHSGTGLGLAIVKSILERHGFDYGISIIEGEIRFYINMKND
ncbi:MULTISPECIES: HAMP domain-containing sensor histidine kinase [Bacillus]|uniref:HAMP domain-containing sensor histidine kinase n=1 Tax=Bacillus TaxID=1386 RepID=UPI000B4B200E|nr:MULTISPECIES: HAMP domain-containing sensor histidine kinase [unclassified Bacillus cereus group]MDA1543745.1 HAMP domain-containing sensor histidine kinase [Bacillus cereus group sp. TH253LC]MDA1578013.1 HAMP domain-containing sensor histidine kinase [Bacillus cereus group sp. TH228LC]MDA1626310.1 HAMP domain-containing sensor histidine kinase [Bacillus cereus group sp. TH172LC]MDA1831826.1 HAMP domain-containing sensor histidine kinase [Bacillus cereus group sp. BY142LC]MDA1836571.1 HAMP 